MTTLKNCSTCLQDKPEEAFHWTSTARTSRHASCKACRAVYQKQYRENGWRPPSKAPDVAVPLPEGVMLPTGALLFQPQAMGLRWASP
jgi:hypothetical protein